MAPVMKPKSTASIELDEPHKVLLYTHHGFGKTFQCGQFQRRYGKGLIISGEGGLKTLTDIDVDYFPFSSWDGPVDPENNIYSFKSIAAFIMSPEFKAAGYKWVAIDSLTEVSDRLMEHIKKLHEKDEKQNGFAIWEEYSAALIGALKWVRDLPVHVLVTALAKEEKDINDATHYWPMVKGSAVSKQIPGLFDHVFCGVRVTEKGANDELEIRRFIVTDEVHGWHGKVRDPYRRVKPIESGDDITELLARMSTKPDKQAA